jgi:hypothetical protein
MAASRYNLFICLLLSRLISRIAEKVGEFRGIFCVKDSPQPLGPAVWQVLEHTPRPPRFCAEDTDSSAYRRCTQRAL